MTEREFLEDEKWWKENEAVACETIDGAVSLWSNAAFFLGDDVKHNTAVILGNEVTGLPTSVILKADKVVEVPMAVGGKNSLNVAVCAGVVGYEWLRRFKKRQEDSESQEKDL